MSEQNYETFVCVGKTFEEVSDYLAHTTPTRFPETAFEVHAVANVEGGCLVKTIREHGGGLDAHTEVFDRWLALRHAGLTVALDIADVKEVKYGRQTLMLFTNREQLFEYIWRTYNSLGQPLAKALRNTQWPAVASVSDNRSLSILTMDDLNTISSKIQSVLDLLSKVAIEAFAEQKEEK